MIDKVIRNPRAATVLRSTGLLRGLEALPRAAGLYVLNYHRIGGGSANPFDSATFSATADELRAQMTYVRAKFATPPASEVLESLRRGRFDAPTALVTFDDGYLDNYELAFPVLRELGVPGCFFVVSGYVDAPTLPWWDRVAYSVRRTSFETISIDYPEPLTFDLRRESRPAVTAGILRAFKRARPLDRNRFFDALATATGVDVDADELAKKLFAPWAALREMQAGGMTIGSHTVTHPVLASLPEDDQLRELADSRERIGEMLGEKPALLAYPVGGPTAFTDVTQRLARDTGYSAAFTFFGGLNLAETCAPFALSRVAVHHSQSFDQFRLKAALTTGALWARFGVGGDRPPTTVTRASA